VLFVYIIGLLSDAAECVEIKGGLLTNSNAVHTEWRCVQRALHWLLTIGLLASIAPDKICFPRFSDKCNARLTMRVWGLRA